MAGLTWTELRRMAPGLILDLYIWHRDYDDEQHGIRRQKDKIFD